MKCMQFKLPEGIPRQKLLHYVLHCYPEWPPHSVRDAFAKRDVKVDGQRVGKDAEAAGGSEVTIYLPGDRLRPVPVLYRDERLLILHKPAGIPCDESRPGERTILQLMQDQLGLEKAPLPVHRLDAPTEGLLILALTEEAQQLLQEAFRQHRIRKEYLCLVKGCPKPPHAVLTAYLHKDALHASVTVHGKEQPGDKEIITEYTVEQAGDVSLLRVQLHTGRTHQIRAHMAFIGHPLIGDDQYGDRRLNRELKANRLKLCSSKLTFETEGHFADLYRRSFQTVPGFLQANTKGE